MEIQNIATSVHIIEPIIQFNKKDAEDFVKHLKLILKNIKPSLIKTDQYEGEFAYNIRIGSPQKHMRCEGVYRLSKYIKSSNKKDVWIIFWKTIKECSIDEYLDSMSELNNKQLDGVEIKLNLKKLNKKL